MTQRLVSEQELISVFEDLAPRPLVRVPVMAQGRAELVRANEALGLAISDDEIDYLVDAYRELDRDPTDVELMMFAQANSEHCRHKIFNAAWQVDGEIQPHSLFDMIRNTHRPINGENILSAYSDNAAVIEGHRSKTAGCSMPNITAMATCVSRAHTHEGGNPQPSDRYCPLSRGGHRFRWRDTR